MHVAVSSLSDEQLDALAVALVQHASGLSRVVFGQLDIGLSRSETGVLARLESGPERITALASMDRLAQPTVTLVVKRLEGLGFVRRDRSAEDGRVVLVSLTEAGLTKLREIRLRYQELLRECLRGLPDDEVAALEPAIRAMDSLARCLHARDAG